MTIRLAPFSLASFSLASSLAAGTLAGFATLALAAPQTYTLDSSHSQVVFSYDHLGFSTTYGMFSGFEGTVTLDPEAPEASSIQIEIPVESMITGWDARTQHFLSPDFFNIADAPVATFTSTGVEPTGEMTANVTGDLTINGVTKEVTLATTINQMGTHPMAQKEWVGLSATATVLRSDFNLGAFAPAVSDEVELIIEIEAEASDA